MTKILRVAGWVLNPNDKTVNSILRAVERNNGECPCSGNTSEDKHCPCSSYRGGKGCCCGLYKPENSLVYKKGEEATTTSIPSFSSPSTTL